MSYSTGNFKIGDECELAITWLKSSGANKGDECTIIDFDIQHMHPIKVLMKVTGEHRYWKPEHLRLKKESIVLKLLKQIDDL